MEAETTLLVRPEHLNHHGFLVGGQLLAWLDEQAYIAVVSVCGPEANLVTVGIDRVQFRESVYKGDMIRFQSSVVHTGRASITAFTRVVRHPTGGEIFSAYTTFVSRGDNGRPVAIAGILLKPFELGDEEMRTHHKNVEQMRKRRKQSDGDA
jgi:acyl-CoA hydrolase